MHIVSPREKEGKEIEDTDSNTRQTQICLSSQLTLNITAWLGMSLKLSLQRFHLLLGQPRARQVLCVFFIVHDRLVVEIHHIKRRRLLRVNVTPLNGMDHGRVRHCRVESNGLVHGNCGMACIGVWVVDVVHDCGRGRRRVCRGDGLTDSS